MTTTFEPKVEKVVREQVERLCEVNRQKKALEAEAEELRALILSTMDDEQAEKWEDDFYACTIVEQAGRESADLKALHRDGLEQYIKVGDPTRFPRAWRK